MVSSPLRVKSQICEGSCHLPERPFHCSSGLPPLVPGHTHVPHTDFSEAVLNFSSGCHSPDCLWHFMVPTLSILGTVLLSEGLCVSILSGDHPWRSRSITLGRLNGQNVGSSEIRDTLFYKTCNSKVKQTKQMHAVSESSVTASVRHI